MREREPDKQSGFALKATLFYCGREKTNRAMGHVADVLASRRSRETGRLPSCDASDVPAASFSCITVPLPEEDIQQGVMPQDCENLGRSRESVGDRQREGGNEERDNETDGERGRENPAFLSCLPVVHRLPCHRQS